MIKRARPAKLSTWKWPEEDEMDPCSPVPRGVGRGRSAKVMVDSTGGTGLTDDIEDMLGVTVRERENQ